jgi:uncharacterized YccA/Bax inhibitor family protein
MSGTCQPEKISFCLTNKTIEQSKVILLKIILLAVHVFFVELFLFKKSLINSFVRMTRKLIQAKSLIFLPEVPMFKGGFFCVPIFRSIQTLDFVP